MAFGEEWCLQCRKYRPVNWWGECEACGYKLTPVSKSLWPCVRIVLGLMALAALAGWWFGATL